VLAAFFELDNNEPKEPKDKDADPDQAQPGSKLRVAGAAAADDEEEEEEAQPAKKRR
jgi:hypothetical protein